MNSMIEKWIEPTLDFITEVNNIQSCKAIGIPFIENRNIEISKEKNQFRFSFLSPLKEHDIINQAKTTNLDQFKIAVENKSYIIPKGSLITSYRDCFDEEQGFSCSISSQWLHSDGFEIGKDYYFRYVIPVGEQNISFRDYASYPFDYYVKGQKRYSNDLIKVILNDIEYHFWSFKDKNDSYLVVDSTTPCSFEEIDKVSLSVLVAHGFLCSTIYLNEAYIIYSEEPHFESPIGIYYKALRETIKGQYSIFTTNSYSVLVSIGKNNDPIKGESEAIKKIKDEDWVNKLISTDEQIFSNLVHLIYTNDSVLRSTMMIVEASKYAIDIQLAIYCVALETISKYVKKKEETISKYVKEEYGIESPKVIENNIWDKLKPKFDEVLITFKTNGIITEEQIRFLQGKVNNMNQPTNKDVLVQSFSKLGYSLSSEELKCVEYRNLSLHGNLPSVDVDKGESELDKLFYVNLTMHKLCSVLILKLAGFEGYIINNVKLHEKNINRNIEEDGFLKI
jgi:hypothetical protein